jgi:hypothetical protein
LQHQTTYSDLIFLKNHLRILLKNSEIFLKKCQKKFKVRLDRSWRAEILHEHASLNVLKHDSQILKFWKFAVDF